MAPSQTVENYLKAIYQAQVALTDPKALVPMGHLSSRLGVVPGTATTMMKTLAESGLVRYEPYTGVRLTAAGEKLAARVLRRHRLIELFLVQVLGMSWTEVHEEAEQLEHAVSDRVIDLMDEMLGRPEVDPHGDPIPGPEGTVAQPEYETLLSCPLVTPVTIRRVSDQDSEFLRFVERHDLKPGQVVQVEDRDTAADSVRLRGGNDREFTIGARAASKVLVQVAHGLLLIATLATPALGQTTAASTRVSAQATQPASEQADPASSRTGPISGYMDFHFNKEEGQDGVLDFHRFVLLFNHSFSPRIRFVGELELEHALVEGLEEAGELELEQAYVDFLLSRGLSVRAGMMLIPLGIINERHEPPVFNGVERPFVDTVIIPTTWFEVGAGIHGEVGRGVRYRVFAVAPLDALEFSADEGIRGGRQKGSEANVRNFAFTGRAEYLGIPDLTVGAGFWTGDSSFSGPRLDTTVRVGEVDARYRRGRLELRGQFAQVGISDAGQLNDALERLTGVSPNIARSLRGFYGEAAYRVWNAGSPRDLVAFLRYENFDTQYRMPDGFLPLKEFDRDAWIVGTTYYPDPDVAVKVDFVRLRNQSDVVKAPFSFNVGLGWWF